jgi:hypothetical protein
MVEYPYAIVPTGVTEDKWIQAVEVRPTERSVVHHIMAFVREPGSNSFKDQKPGVFFEAHLRRRTKTWTRAHCRATFWLGMLPVNRQRCCPPAKRS